MEHVCIIHIGLHKTGTTSIQKMLAAEEGLLRQCGFYLPRAGRDDRSLAHHLLAKEVNRIPGLERGSPNREALSRELMEMQFPRRVLLSSEGFCMSIHDPDVVARLRRETRELGYRLRVIAYVRPQETTVQSIYTQKLKLWAVRTDFDQFWPDAIKDIRFDYDRRFAALFAAEDIELSIYPFNRSTIGAGICRHFLTAIGVPLARLDEFTERSPANVSPGPKAIAAILAIGHELEQRGIKVSKSNLDQAAHLVRRMSKAIGWNDQRFNALTNETVTRIRAHFEQSNSRFAARAFGRAWEDVFGGGQDAAHDCSIFEPKTAPEDERAYFEEFVAGILGAIFDLELTNPSKRKAAPEQ